MASLQVIAKAKTTAYLMGQIFGLAPEIQYYDDYARLYYQKSSLPMVRARLRELTASQPGEIRVDWFPIVSNEILKKSIPVIFVSIAVGYLLANVK